MSDLQFTIDRDDFAAAARWAASALPARPLTPVLSCVRLTADAGGPLGLAAFDYEVAAGATAAADVTAAGTTLVSGRLLQAVTKALPRQPVEFRTEGSVARIVCGPAEVTLPTVPVGDYPNLPSPPPDAGRVDAALFGQAVAQTVVATHRGAGFEAIQSVCLDVSEGALTLSATDRYRVSTRTIPWAPAVADVQARLLVPVRALGDVANLGGDTVGVGFAAADARLLSFCGEHRRTITNLIGADFPDVRRVLPAEHAAVAAVVTQALAEPLARALALDARDLPRVRLAFEPGEPGVLHLSGGEDGVGGIREDVPVDFAGQPLELWLNPRYLLDGLNAARADKVAIGLSEPKRPILLAPYDAPPAGDGPFPALTGDYLYLLMPTRDNAAA